MKKTGTHITEQKATRQSSAPMTSAEKPAAPSGPSLEELEARIAVLDPWLVVLVLLLAFLLGSFTARNSDFWLHLGTGRLLAEGKYRFGVDPFAYTTGAVYWVNHSWLYDLLLYWLNLLARGPEELGGIICVVLKALLAALLAGVMLTIRRPGQSLWAPASCVTIALLAMAPRLTLQPVCVSLFFLGLTGYFLAREGKKQATRDTRGLGLLFTTSPRRLYALPVLFLLWVNIDEWFWLGPLCAALVLLGEKLQQLLAPERTGSDAAAVGEYRTLLWVFGLGLAACLINPHHFRAFTLPAELLPGRFFPGMHNDPRFQLYYITPFTRAYWGLDSGLNVAGLAYYPLLVLGLASFVLTWHDWRMWRLCVWFGFALLSTLSMLAIPFFAVVAGPITALNLQDFWVAYLGTGMPAERRVQRLLLIGRLATVLAGVALLGCAWPGWLHPGPSDPYSVRRVAWGIEVNPSLKSVCYQLDYWRTQGLLADGEHGFNFSPEIAHYCAWYCPQARGFLDARARLFPGVAKSYGDLRYVLSGNFGRPPDPERSGPPGRPDWQKTFRQHGVNHIILTGANWEVTRPILLRLLNEPHQWTLLYLDGRTTVFGWNDPEQKRSDRFATLRLNFRAPAFGPNPEQAPAGGPGRLPRRETALERYLYGVAPPPLDADRSALELIYFDTVARQWGERTRLQWWLLTAGGVFGAVDAAAGALPSLSAAHGRLAAHDSPLLGEFLRQRDRGPPGLPLLALRAGWRAVALNPDDPDSYLALARAVDALLAAQENHWAPVLTVPLLSPLRLRQLLEQREPLQAYLSPWVTHRVSFRVMLRRVQALTALHAILERQPDAPRIHELLFTTYWSMGYYDSALEHLRAQIKSLETAGAKIMSPDAARDLAQRRQLLGECAKEVTDLQGYYEFEVAQYPAQTQAVIAFQPFGFANQALSMLLRDPTAIKSPQQLELVIYLLLTTGRAHECRHVLTEVQQKALGPVSFAVYQTIQLAAVGDYGAAGQQLEAALEKITPTQGAPLLHLLQGTTFGQMQLHRLTRDTLLPFLREQAIEGHRALVAEQQQLNDLRALRGLLALDIGDTATAARFFEQCLTRTGPRYHFESEPIAARYLALIRGK